MVWHGPGTANALFVAAVHARRMHTQPSVSPRLKSRACSLTLRSPPAPLPVQCMWTACPSAWVRRRCARRGVERVWANIIAKTQIASDFDKRDHRHPHCLTSPSLSTHQITPSRTLWWRAVARLWRSAKKRGLETMKFSTEIISFSQTGHLLSGSIGATSAHPPTLPIPRPHASHMGLGQGVESEKWKMDQLLVFSCPLAH